jgi:NAD(P)-dependent dehydrogenase (short-subunit alcohol dehydrogenase family)
MTGSSLENKRVVVIGGSSGIGFAVARAALDAGAKVTIASSQQANVDAALQKLGGGAEGAAFSVNDEAAVAGFFERLGGLDHLAFTAGDWGARTQGSATELDIAAGDAVFKVRFWGAVTAVKHAARVIAQDGSITLTNGTVAHRPRKGAPLSTAMAGSIEHLTRALAVDLAPVRVNVVCPALILTDVWNSILPAEARAERLLRMTERQPLPRPGDPAEVAEAYLYSMRAGYTTGQVLKVDGGATLV